MKNNYFEINSFTDKKMWLFKQLKSLDHCADSVGADDIRQVISRDIKSLNDECFNIVVVGEFSRGKSAFINALIGSPVLPSSKRPTTAILNKVKFSKNKYFRLHYLSKEDVVEVDEDTFKKLVAPAEPDHNDKDELRQYEDAVKKLSEIEYAEIGYPISGVTGDIVIVDTPGTNDLDLRREEITYKFIPESDAAIFLLSANQALAKSEKNFLRDRIVSEMIAKIFIVINFKDKLECREDELKVIEHVKKGLSDLIHEPKVYLVSSKEALNHKLRGNGDLTAKVTVRKYEDTGFDNLELELSRFLTEERGKAKLEKYSKKGIRLCDELVNSYIEVKILALNMGVQELEAKIKQLEPVVAKTKNNTRNVIRDLKRELETISEEVRQAMKSGLLEIAYAANNAVDQYRGELEVSKIANQVESVVAPMQTKLHEKLTKMQSEMVINALIGANRMLGYHLDQLESGVIDSIVGKAEQKPKKILTGDILDVSEMNHFISVSKTTFDYRTAFTSFLDFISSSISYISSKVDEYFWGGSDRKALAHIRYYVDDRYRGVIPKLLEQHKKNREHTNTQILEDISIEVNRKLRRMETQLQSTLNEKKKAKEDSSHKVKQLKEMKAAVMEIKDILQVLLEDSIVKEVGTGAN